MTRFGRYAFLPSFMDDLAGYYHDRQPRLANVSGRLHFDTPTPDQLVRSLVYTISSLPANQLRVLERQSFPQAGDTVLIMALPGGRLYEPIPQYLDDAYFILADTWRSTGGATRPDPLSNDNLSSFLHRSYTRIRYFTDNRQGERLGSSDRTNTSDGWISVPAASVSERRRGVRNRSGAGRAVPAHPSR